MASRLVPPIVVLLAAVAAPLHAQQTAASPAQKVDPAAIRRACEACAKLSAKADDDVRGAVAPLATAAIRSDGHLLEPLIAALEGGAEVDAPKSALLAAAGPAVRPFVARLAAIAKGDDPAALARAVLALRAIAPFARDRKVVAVLVRGLGHADDAVKQAAVEALLEIAPEEPALRRHFFDKLVTNGDFLGPSDVEALAKTGLDADLARFVVARLSSDSRGESYNAGELVKRLDPRSATTLVDALLDGMRAAPPEARPKLIEAFEPLGAAAAAAAPDLARLIADESPEVRAATIETLNAVAPASEELAGAAIHGLRDADEHVRTIARNVFASVAPEQVAPFLTSKAARDDVSLRCELVTLLAEQLGTARALASDGSADAEVRQADDREKRLLDVLLAAARDPAADVRVAALTRLSATAGPPARVLDTLGAALSDPEPTVRSTAAAAVHELGELALPLLDQLARSLDDDDHDAQLAKGEALATLFAALPAADVAAALPTRAVDLSIPELAAAAARAHAEGSGELPPLTSATARMLFDAMARPADPGHAAALALAHEEFDHFDRATEQVFIEALASPDGAVRRAAASWLDSDSPDPLAATQALLKRLGDPDDDGAAAVVESLTSFRPLPLSGIETSLQAQDALVRRRALVLIGAIGADARPLVPRVLQLLADPDAAVRDEACRAFFELVASASRRRD